MASRYPQGSFIFATMDARSSIANRWSIDIPTSVTNEDILSASLLSLDINPKPGYSFEDVLLAQFYAPIFTANTFPFTQVTTLLNSIDQRRWMLLIVFRY